MPHKNLQKVGEWSLVERAIKFAKFVSEFTFVSSDSVEIVELARVQGVTGVKRPKKISGDLASSESAVIHTLQTNRIKATKFEPTDIVTILQCTSPFQDIQAFKLGEKLIKENEADSIFSADKVFPFTWKVKEGGDWAPLNHPKTRRPMRQELGETVVETGAFYMIKLGIFLRSQFRFSGRVKPVTVDVSTICDIDTVKQLEDAKMRAVYMDKKLQYLSSAD